MRTLNWFIYDGVTTEQVGPLELEDARKHVAGAWPTAKLYAWCEGMAGWTEVAKVPELNGARNAMPARSAPPPPPKGARAHGGGSSVASLALVDPLDLTSGLDPKLVRIAKRDARRASKGIWKRLFG